MTQEAMNFEENLIRQILQGVADCHSKGVGFKINLDYVTDCTPQELMRHVRHCHDQGWIEGNDPMPMGNHLIVTFDGQGLKEQGREKLQSLQ